MGVENDRASCSIKCSATPVIVIYRCVHQVIVVAGSAFHSSVAGVEGATGSDGSESQTSSDASAASSSASTSSSISSSKFGSCSSSDFHEIEKVWHRLLNLTKNAHKWLCDILVSLVQRRCQIRAIDASSSADAKYILLSFSLFRVEQVIIYYW